MLSVAVLGCEKAPEKPAAKGSAVPVAPLLPATEKSESGHGGEVVALGTTKLDAFEVRASRDKGEIKPGGEAPIDVWIDGGVGKDISVVRFWIGTQDAKGAAKAKAAIEDGKWHTHAEIPDPLPTGSKLWVEIETADGKKAIGSFDLKM